MSNFFSKIFGDKTPPPITPPLPSLTVLPETSPIKEDSVTVAEKIHFNIAAMTQGLVAREQQASMLLLAALAGETALLFGPPGTGKSLLARRL